MEWIAAENAGSVPGFPKGIHGPHDIIIALGAFGLLHFWKTPPWLVVLLATAAGGLFLG